MCLLDLFHFIVSVFCIPIPQHDFSCDSEFSDKKQSYVALGQVVLFLATIVVFRYVTMGQKIISITTFVHLTFNEDNLGL